MPGIARLNKHLIAYAKKKRLRRERTKRGRWKSTGRKYEMHEEKCIVFHRDGSARFANRECHLFLFIFLSPSPPSLLSIFNASVFRKSRFITTISQNCYLSRFKLTHLRVLILIRGHLKGKIARASVMSLFVLETWETIPRSIRGLRISN